jgi:hypothetical protein
VIAAVLCALVSQAGLLNRRAPGIDVADFRGHRVTNASLRGTPVLLFVFCSCRECHAVAEEWSSIQKRGILQTRAYRDGPVQTLISFLGSRTDAERFAKETTLSLSAADYLDDPKMTIARDYRALPCPAAFVVDRTGVVRYASKEVAGELVSSARVLVGQALAALKMKTHRALASRAVGLSGVPKPGPRLTPLPSKDEVSSLPSDVTWTPSAADLTRPGAVSHSFRFSNRARKPIQVGQVLASCGCQSTVLLKQGRAVTSPILQPGETVDLRVTVRLSGDGQPKIVSAWIYSRTMAPLATVRLLIGH